MLGLKAFFSVSAVRSSISSASRKYSKKKTNLHRARIQIKEKLTCIAQECKLKKNSPARAAR
jgi:hypothetical protein